jgi:hypothetical protein
MSKKIIGYIYGDDEDSNTGSGGLPDGSGFKKLLFYIFTFIWLAGAEKGIFNELIILLGCTALFAAMLNTWKDSISEHDKDQYAKRENIAFYKFLLWTASCITMIIMILNNSGLSFSNYSTFVSPLLIIIFWFKVED